MKRLVDVPAPPKMVEKAWETKERTRGQNVSRGLASDLGRPHSVRQHLLVDASAHGVCTSWCLLVELVYRGPYPSRRSSSSIASVMYLGMFVGCPGG